MVHDKEIKIMNIHSFIMDNRYNNNEMKSPSFVSSIAILINDMKIMP
jgi:hypothetical protein